MLEAEILIFISLHFQLLLFFVFINFTVLSGRQFIAGANGYPNNEQNLSMF